MKQFKCVVTCDNCGEKAETTGTQRTIVRTRKPSEYPPYETYHEECYYQEEQVDVPKGWLFFNSANVKSNNKKFSFDEDPEFCCIKCLLEWFDKNLRRELKLKK